MSTPDTTTEPVRNTLTIGGQTVTIERPSARKATQAFRIIRSVSDAVQSISARIANFGQEYRRDHVLEVSRAQARLRYPAVPMIETGDDGVDRVVAHPETGEVMMRPSPIDAMTEADWERSDHVLKLPVPPTQAQTFAAALDVILDSAEEPLYRLLALMVMTNVEVKEARRGDFDAVLTAKVEELLDDAALDELLELLVVVFEVVDDQFRAKARAIGGGRLGKTMRTLGLELPTSPTMTSATQETSASSEKPTSSTASPAPTPDGPPTTSSSSPMSSSSDSTPASSETDVSPPKPTAPEPQE